MKQTAILIRGGTIDLSNNSHPTDDNSQILNRESLDFKI